MPARVLLPACAIALVLGVLPPSAHASGHAGSLRVAKAVVDVDRGLVVVDLRCVAARARCSGLLSARVDGEAVTGARRVRLTRARRRVALRLRAGALRARELATVPEDEIVLRRGRATSVADAFFEPRLACRSGDPVATSEAVRVFAAEGFGLHACARPAGRPLALTEQGVGWSRDPAPATAGRYVAFERNSGSSHCTLREIVVVDVLSRRVMRARRTMQFVPARDACSGPSIADFVLRPSGAVAWTEPPADGANVLVRAVDAGGDRLLARGPSIDAGSLVAVDDTTVGWLDGVERRTAPLP